MKLEILNLELLALRLSLATVSRYLLSVDYVFHDLEIPPPWSLC